MNQSGEGTRKAESGAALRVPYRPSGLLTGGRHEAGSPCVAEPLAGTNGPSPSTVPGPEPVVEAWTVGPVVLAASPVALGALELLLVTLPEPEPW
jgi:hypothetical protein